MGLYSNKILVIGGNERGRGITQYVEGNSFYGVVGLRCVLISIDTSVNMQSIHVVDLNNKKNHILNIKL